jgi:lysophospholipase L1-like esterase
MGDANADWLASGLEEAFSDDPEIAVVRKHRTDSGLIRYDQRRESEWPQVAREIIAAEKPDLVIMMIGNNDRQSIREKAPPAAPANALPEQPTEAGAAKPPESERQAAERQHPKSTPAQARQEASGPLEFQSEKWEQAYIKRIAATIAALKSGGVPVIWVGLPSQRDTDASADASYLNELYRSEAEKEGIVYADIWGGFVDEAGNFASQGPDYLGQTRRLRSSDGVYFTKFGARKLAHYVEREMERIDSNKSVPVALPVPVGPDPQAPKGKADGAAQRPAAGPVVPLTQTQIAPEELLGADPTPAVAGASMTGALGKGGLLTAPSGRADDFSWPRSIVNVEPPGPDVAAAPDAGPAVAKSAQRKSPMNAYASQTDRERKPPHRRARANPSRNSWAHQRPNMSFFGTGW